MVSSGYNTLLVVGVIVAVGLIGWLVAIAFRDREKPKGPTLWNFDPNQAHGHVKGIIKEVIYGAGGRVRITFLPTDVDVEKLKEKKLTLQNETIIVSPHRFFPLPSPSFSGEEDIFISLPEDPEDFSEALQTNPVGLAFKQMMLETDFAKKQIEIMKNSMNSRDEMLKDLNGGEISEEWIKTFKGLNKEAFEVIFEWMQSRKKTDSFPAPQGGVHA